MEEGKIFYDPIHGYIELHPVCVAIVDTPQFQRLRHISQLGGAYYLYPGATHNRFEHSLGVSHLAKKLALALQKQAELDITDKDILCVEIAGLCHDLGHGPFSHMFDKKFIPQVYHCHGEEERWKHEDASVNLYEYMKQENPHLAPMFDKYGLDEMDHLFIKEQMAGPFPPGIENAQPARNGRLLCHAPKWPFRGRSSKKGFLYDIVANKRNGIDVDKWDYIARDCAMLGLQNTFDHQRLIHHARVITVNGEKQICFRLKEAENVQAMFVSRRTLHRQVCQQRVTFIVEQMLAEALIAADDQFQMITRRDDVPLKISDCVKKEHVAVYCELTDAILRAIVTSRNPQLKDARDILGRIDRRDLYTFVDETRPKTQDSDLSSCDEPRIAEKLAAMDSGGRLRASDLVIQVAVLGFGSKGSIADVYFYQKNEFNWPCKVHKAKVAQEVPETVVRVYCKNSNEEIVNLVRQCFEEWCLNNGMWSYKEEEERPRRSSLLKTKTSYSFY